ncbi:hypothetical protein [Arthrobacter sp. ISL-72]|nr:hypothetical protein [Arthrobacter sp. ISL-72]
MPEQRRSGYRWNLRALAKRNLRKTTELMQLLRSHGILHTAATYVSPRR